MNAIKENLPTLITASKVVGKFFGPGSVDELSLETILAINLWYLGEPAVKAEVFPDVNTGDRVLSDQFTIDGWGRVWFQRAFWVNHPKSGKSTRWIDGRTAPMG